MISAHPDLQAVPIASLPVVLRFDDAFEIAHGPLLDLVDKSLTERTSVLVRCPREAVLPMLQGLRARFKRTRNKDAGKLVLIDGLGGGETSAPHPLDRMREQLREASRNGVDDRVLVLTDLVALLGGGDPLDRDARATLPLLFADPATVFLAFCDPQHPLPRVAAPIFRVRASLDGPAVEALPKLVTQREARAMHATELDAVALHRFVGAMNAQSLRRALEAVGRQHEAPPGRSRRPEIYGFLRAWTADGHAVPSERFELDHAGHAEVREVLSRELVALHRRRTAPGPEDDVAALTEVAPRTVLLSGPRGGGKRLLARCVANALGAVVLEIDGAALPDVPSALAHAVSDVVSTARRVAPSLIVLDGFDAMNAEARARWIDALTNVPRAESLILVALDHRGVASGGRFELCVEVPRLTAEDRTALVAHFSQKLGLRDVRADDVIGETAAELLASLRTLRRRALLDGV